MKTFRPSALRGRAASTATLAAAAVLALSLTGCGNDTSGAAQDAPTSRATTSDVPASETTTEPAPAVEDSSAAVGPSLSSLGRRDEDPRIDFPGEPAVFPDGSSAFSDGETLTVTTNAEERVSMKLPTSAEGWFHGTTVFLGDAGTGYLVTQSGGEYLNTFLAVLDDGELYVAATDDEVAFGQFAGEGPRFETYTTDAGNHLVTVIDDQGPDGETEHYEWTVEDRTLVPTLLS